MPGPGAHATRDALDDVPDDAQDAYTKATELVPGAWADLLPHPTFSGLATVVPVSVEP